MPKDIGDILVFHNNNGEEFEESLDRIAKLLN
jgi:hypothetical protein